MYDPLSCYLQDDMSARDISTARKRRGIARGSVTRLTNRLKDLESRPSDPSTLTLAQQMLKNVEMLNSDFKTHYLALIDLLEEEEALQKEQEILDEHATRRWDTESGSRGLW